MPDPQGEVISPGEIPGTTEGPEGIVAGQAPAGYRYVVKQGNRTRWVWWVLDPEDPTSDSGWKQVTDIVQYWGLEPLDPQEALSVEQQKWLQDFNEREFAYRKEQDWEKRQEQVGQWAKDYLLKLQQLDMEDAAQKALELFRQTEFDWRVATAAKELELELRKQGFVEQAEAFRQKMDAERFAWEKEQSAEQLAFDREQLAQQQKQWEDQYALELERLGLDKEAAEFRRIMEEKRLGLDTTIAEQNFRLALERLGLDKQAQEFEQNFAKERFGFEKEQAAKDYALELERLGLMKEAEAFRQLMEQKRLGLDTTVAEQNFRLSLQRLGLDTQAQIFDQKFATTKFGFEKEQAYWERGFAEKQFAYQLTKDQQDRLAAMIPQMATMSAAGRAAFKDILKGMGIDLDAMLRGVVRAQTPWMKGAPEWAPWGETLRGGGVRPTGEPYTDEEIAALNAAVLGQGAGAQQGAPPGTPQGAPLAPGQEWYQDPVTGQWGVRPTSIPPPPAQPPPLGKWGGLPPGVPAPPPEAGGGWGYDFATGQWKPPGVVFHPKGVQPPPAQPPPTQPPPLGPWGGLPPGISQPPPEATGGWWYDYETGQWRPPVPPGQPGGHLPPGAPPLFITPPGIPQPKPPPRVGPLPPGRPAPVGPIPPWIGMTEVPPSPFGPILPWPIGASKPVGPLPPGGPAPKGPIPPWRMGKPTPKPVSPFGFR